MKVYIAGVVSLGGTLSDIEVAKNLLEFSDTAGRLKAEGYEVVNPALNGHGPWPKLMAACIKQLVDCDTIYLLPGWTQSPGARLEFHIASALGFDIIVGSQLAK